MQNIFCEYYIEHIFEHIINYFKLMIILKIVFKPS